MYLNYYQHERATQEAKLMNGTITDLRYQVAQDKLTMAGSSPSASPEPSDSPSPAPSASPSPNPSPAGTPAVAGASTVAVNLVKACNLHIAASKTSAIIIRYTSFTRLPLPVTLNGGKVGIYQNITVNGKTGFVESSCLQ